MTDKTPEVCEARKRELNQYTSVTGNNAVQMPDNIILTKIMGEDIKGISISKEDSISIDTDGILKIIKPETKWIPGNEPERKWKIPSNL